MSEKKAKDLLNEINKKEDNLNLLKKYRTSDNDKPIIEKLLRILHEDKEVLEDEIRKLYSDNGLF